jgi:hypothetical protein
MIIATTTSLLIAVPALADPYPWSAEGVSRSITNQYIWDGWAVRSVSLIQTAPGHMHGHSWIQQTRRAPWVMVICDAEKAYNSNRFVWECINPQKGKI